jgi:FkbM family methyltransferase
MGRKNLFYFIKQQGLRLNLDYRRQGALVYPLNIGWDFVLHQGNRLSELVFLEGAYEPFETMLVSRVVRQNDIVFDCGANVGYFTALLDRLVKPRGQVHAFEPGGGTFSKLKQTKALLNLDRSVLHARAVGSFIGEIDFWASTSGWDAQQKIVPDVAQLRSLRRDRVAATTLDTVLAALPARDAGRVALVKCDIEGAETAMLKGAGDLLNAPNPPVWLIEHNRLALGDQGSSSAELLSFFAGCDIYYMPICWPPSVMAAPQAARWDGRPEDLPDECNLFVFPRRGIYGPRAASLRAAGLLI